MPTPPRSSCHGSLSRQLLSPLPWRCQNCFFLLTISLFLPLSCHRQSSTQTKPQPRPVKAVVVEDASTLERDFVGLSTPDDAVNLAFKIGGQVLEIPVSKGEAVERGQLIAELDPRDVELEVAATRSAYEEAQSQLQRMKRLLAHEAISMQEYESASTRHAQRKASYENALSLLNDTRIRAPYAGVIERTYVDAFQRVEAGESIARLVNPTTRTVSFTLPESSLHLLDLPTTRFRVRFDNYPGVSFEAMLKNHAKTSTDASGFPTSLTLLNPDPQRYPVAPGISCTITLLVADTLPHAVSIPLSALYAPASGGLWVWRINAQNRVERQAVVTGPLQGSDRVLVEQGLQAGERIVTAGVYRLREGEPVKILNP